MKVKVLCKQVGKAAELRDVEDDYRVLQQMCGGCFSAYSVTSFVREPDLRNVVIYCNDTGKLDGLPPNCFIGSELFVGDIVFYAYDHEGGGIDLTGYQALLLTMCIKDLREIVGPPCSENASRS